MSALLEVRGLTRSFGVLRAVDGLSFQVDAGQIVGFIGPNGAGKTTTMRMIATLEVPTDGDILLEGKSVVERPDQARPRIGYMPDRYGTYEAMTVEEYLDFFGRAYRLNGTERRRRMESVLEFTGLAPLRERLTTELSKGMKQRVALGRTLLHDPPLLVLDEPADGLDPRARIELRELLRALADQGKAILVSSHILTELGELSDRCVIIEQGRLVAEGSVAELLARDAGGPVHEVQLRLASGGQEALVRAERVALEQPHVAHSSIEDGVLVLRLKLPAGQALTPHWADPLCAELLRRWVSAGLPVCAFEARTANLEDAFMSATRGKVA
jgi:ABC-2 type transport system ATP-binding protein